MSFRRWLLALSTLLVIPVALGAVSLVGQVPDLIGADAVVVGTIGGSVVEWRTNRFGDQVIVTTQDLAVEGWLRGGGNATVDLETDGGTIGTQTLRTSEDAILAQGIRAIFLLDRDGSHYRLHGKAKGVLPLFGSAGFTTTGHKWSSGSVSYFVNPDNLYVTSAQAIAAIQAAVVGWNTSGAAITLAYSGTTTNASLINDGTNNVFFRNDGGGFIAETYWWWDGTGRLVDADIVYHEGYAFYSDDQVCTGYSIANTGAHEFGHVLGLNHSDVSTATMWASEDVCETSKETLDPDDIAGIQSLYGTGAPPPPGKPPHGRGHK